MSSSLSITVNSFNLVCTFLLFGSSGGISLIFIALFLHRRKCQLAIFGELLWHIALEQVCFESTNPVGKGMYNRASVLTSTVVTLSLVHFIAMTDETSSSHSRLRAVRR